jgi:hypothetical protein
MQSRPTRQGVLHRRAIATMRSTLPRRFPRRMRVLHQHCSGAIPIGVESTFGSSADPLLPGTQLSSANRKIVVKGRPSPGDIHDGGRRAQMSSRYHIRLAACACCSPPRPCPVSVPVNRDLMTVVVHVPVLYRQPQMAFVGRDHEVKTLPPQGAAKTLANRVRSGCPHGVRGIATCICFTDVSSCLKKMLSLSWITYW